MRSWLRKLRRNPRLVLDYVIGNYRYFIYSRFPLLIRKHIREQYKWRLQVMNQKCLNNGECIKCGCKTPNLQFASKSCEGKCYPEFMNKRLWNLLSNSKIGLVWIDNFGNIKKVKVKDGD